MYQQRILTKNENHKTITFVILEPGVEDRNGDIISTNEIIKTAHEFMSNLHLKKVNVNHEKDSDIEWVRFVESFILPVDLPIEEEVVKAWSWLVGFKFNNEQLYKQVISGEIVGVSMEGYRMPAQ